MKKIYLLLLLLIACGKPMDTTKANYPVYGSISTISSATELPCYNCLMIEINGRNLRISFSDNSIDECSGQGVMLYLANSNTQLPTTDGESADLFAFIQGNNSSKNPICFPNQLDMKFTQFSNSDGTFYELDYGGKLYKMKKLN